VTLTVSGDPAALETGLQLAYLLLTDPVVEPGAFAQWREGKLREIAERAREPRGALEEVQADAFYPAGEARLRPVTAAQVGALTREATQAWLRGLIARAPVEVAVVGDIDRARALALVARYLGALPSRPRVGDKTLRDLRSVPRPVGPLRVERAVPTRTDQAQVLDGFFAADVQQVRDSRLLILATRVLSTRMNRALREERQLVYSIGARLQMGEAFPGFGIFAAQAPTDPAKAGALAEAVAEMFAAFAADGPSADELTVARGQLLKFLDEALRGPEFWSMRLATLEYRGLSLDDLARITADYQRFTAEEVRQAFARYARPEARFRIVVLPERPR
jgi:zinc protease